MHNLITLEGVDGTGKTTHIDFIRNYFVKLGYKVECLREPGGCEVSEKIRDILFQINNMASLTELLLFCASRNELLIKCIKPALERGSIVIIDRFIDSTIVYQGIKFGIEYVKHLITLLHLDIMPALTLLFHADVEVIAKRLVIENHFDDNNISHLNTLQNMFLELQKEDSTRIKLVNSSNSVEETKGNIIHCLRRWLNIG